MTTIKNYTVRQHPNFKERLQIITGDSNAAGLPDAYIHAEMTFIVANGKVCVEDEPTGSTVMWYARASLAINRKQAPASKHSRPAFKPFIISVTE